ncbi:MAG: histidine phosphatase family protein [Acidimicrobiaceae bacterium]|nr:histidine phosphatase family protein [Acidimicrobiaceae bacterium]
MTRLVLVRHGESIVTVNRVIGGPRTCSGLSPLGREQADRLRARWVANPEFEADVLLASQYPRAIETAEIVASSLGGLAVSIDDGFGEHDPGPECDGLTYKEYMERYDIGPEAWDSGDPFATTFPGGETVASFQFRVGSAVRRTLDHHAGKTVVVACHGGVVDAVLRLALRAPGMGSFQIHTLNTSITELQLVKPNVWRLNRYNDTAHLAGLPANTNPPSAVGA